MMKKFDLIQCKPAYTFLGLSIGVNHKSFCNMYSKTWKPLTIFTKLSILGVSGSPGYGYALIRGPWKLALLLIYYRLLRDKPVLGHWKKFW